MPGSSSTRMNSDAFSDFGLSLVVMAKPRSSNVPRAACSTGLTSLSSASTVARASLAFFGAPGVLRVVEVDDRLALPGRVRGRGGELGVVLHLPLHRDIPLRDRYGRRRHRPGGLRSRSGRGPGGSGVEGAQYPTIPPVGPPGHAVGDPERAAVVALGQPAAR